MRTSRKGVLDRTAVRPDRRRHAPRPTRPPGRSPSSNPEEEAVGLTDVVPFLVEDELEKLGGIYSRTTDWASHVVQNDLLITGQNPSSSTVAAAALIARHSLTPA